MACSEADWLRWLPATVGDLHWKQQAQSAGVRIGDGALGLKWQVAPPRRNDSTMSTRMGRSSAVSNMV